MRELEGKQWHYVVFSSALCLISYSSFVLTFLSPSFLTKGDYVGWAGSLAPSVAAAFLSGGGAAAIKSGKREREREKREKEETEKGREIAK
jgi:hypothetical protein